MIASPVLRRLVTLPALPLLSVLLLGAVPLVVPLLAITDAVRGRKSSFARTYLLVAAYAVLETVAVVAAIAYAAFRPVGLACARAFARLRGRPAPDPRAFEWPFVHVQSFWTRSLLAVGIHLFRLRVEVEGDTALAGGPMLLLMRHSSIGDTVLPSVFVTQRVGIRLRYVLKKELLLDPALDVVGHRIPNCFVDRSSVGTEQERRAVTTLMRGLADDEGVVIYPEGTVFDERRRRDALARLRDRVDAAALARAEALRYVLPPRLGGTTALLEANPGLDVVFGAHVGFEGAVGFRSLVDGGWLDQTIRVRFRRVPFAELPKDAAGRAAFVLDSWDRMDAEVGELHARGSVPRDEPADGDLRSAQSVPRSCP